ncbi:MAG TPA: hypothetical protein VIG47_09305 [Gemmatimonadaceae bacterium]|jgi:hypothetical protein
MKTIAVMGLLAVMACASGGPGSNGVGSVGGGDQDANVQHMAITVPSRGSIDLEADARSTSPIVWSDVHASVAQTWQYLPLAYKKLGLSITRYDPNTHIIEGERLRSHADFGGKELTSIMDCGNVMGMPNASRFDVNIMTRTVLRGSDTGSSVASTVIATAKPGDVSGVLTPCMVNSTAADRIAAAVTDVATSAQ